jgi:tripartite-type tricarboxylate transporter receptor subunit TctC
MAALGLVLGTLLPSPTHAQTYPERPITLVVPFPPGGGNDSIARELGQLLQEKLGQPIIVDNRGGAGGAIGAGVVSRAEPDGYTLLFASSTFVTHAVVDKKTPYDVTEDFTPIALLGRGPLMVVVNKDTDITSIQQLIEKAKAEPDALNYCTTGLGSINHLVTEAFIQKTGAKMTHVPYKGSGPAITDLLGGQVQVFFATVPAIVGHVRTDQVKLLATTGKDRPKAFPDVPTVAEAVGDYDMQTWWSIVGPAGLPPDIVAKLNQAINEATASAAMQKRFDTEGAESFQGKPDDLARLLRDQATYFRQVAQAAGL